MQREGECIYYRNEYCALDSNECLFYNRELKPYILGLPEKYCYARTQERALDIRNYATVTGGWIYTENHPEGIQARRFRP